MRTEQEYKDLEAERDAAIASFHAAQTQVVGWQKQCEELAARVQEMREALAHNQQVFAEIYHARMKPNWFTNGAHAAEQHFFIWLNKGKVATEEALATPDTSAKIIAELKAAVWMEAAEVCNALRSAADNAAKVHAGLYSAAFVDAYRHAEEALRAKHDELMKGVEG